VRRNRLIAALLAGVTLSATAGWVAATHVKSPGEVAAETKPPPASDITAAVDRRELATTVTGRGTVRYGEPQTITLAASTYGNAQGSSLVTKPPTKGAVVGENAVAMEVNGRPVRALAGAAPMYRDIKPGDQGRDVRQLEEALQRLGFHPGKVDGVYDIATQGAVEAWYRAAGYTAVGATDDQRTQLRNAHTAVSNAESAVLQATDALAKVRKGITAKDVRQAENEVRARSRDLDKANDDLKVAQAAEALAHGAEYAAALAEGVARNAETKVATDNRLALARAAGDVTAAQHRVTEAGLAKTAADQKLADDQAAHASNGVIAQDQADVQRAADTLNEAQTDSATALLAQQSSIANADQATQQAQLDTARAVQSTRQAELATLQAVQSTYASIRAIDAAKDAAALADAGLELVKSPPDEESAQASLAKAQSDLADATKQEAALAATIGIVVPANEVLFFPTLPLRVDDAKVGRGDDASKEVMVVTTSRLAIDGAVSVADAHLVHVGDKVAVSDSQLGIKTTGTVTKLQSKPGTNGLTAQQVYLEVVPDEAPDQLTGAAVALSISVTATNGKVLAVPVSAVTVDASGSSRVRVVGKDGTHRTVPVTTGLAADGYVEVRPRSGSLQAGDRVLVGSTHA